MVTMAVKSNVGQFNHVKNAFKQLRGVVQNNTDLMDEIGGYLVSQFARRFETSTAPDGSPWKKSIRVEQSQGIGKTLVQRGHLRDSFTHKAEQDKVSAGTNMIYAGVHQFGQTIKAKGSYLVFKIGNRFVKKKSVTIPARPMVGFAPNDERAITRMIVKKYQGALA